MHVYVCTACAHVIKSQDSSGNGRFSAVPTSYETLATTRQAAS